MVQQSEQRSEEQHIVTCPWSVEEKRAGGVDTVMVDLARSEKGLRTTIFSTDPADKQYDNVKIRAAAPEDGTNGHPFAAWFKMGDWQLMHPDAHTAPILPEDVLQEMYQASQSSPHDLGTLQRLLDHVRQFGPNGGEREAFNSRFDELLTQIPEGATVNWQDFFFVPSINKHAEQLNDANCFQTFHWHSALPDSLHESVQGRNALSAMSKVDTVFVHTDEYARRLERQLEGLGMHIPTIERYDLGVDSNHLKRTSLIVTPDNYQTAVPGYDGLHDRQKDIIREAFATRETVPHRFFCLDRSDPIKGTYYVVEGIESFLNDELQRLGSLEKLRENYRFFGLHDLVFNNADNSESLMDGYTRKVQQKYREVAEAFPGVIFYSPPLSGEQRVAIPGMMLGCHGITGGAQDGLNLAIMEIAVVNEDFDTAIISGNGAGFSMQAIENGSGDMGFFPEAGSAAAFAESFHDVCTMQRQAPGTLGSAKQSLLSKEIYPRQATMAVSRFD